MGTMATLLDIAPSTSVESVWTSDGQRLVVHGLSFNAVASIVSRYPKLLSVKGSENVAWHLIANGGNAVGVIIAAACGELGNEDAEAHANSFLMEDQLKLIIAILGLTFPNGIGSFMERLTQALSVVGAPEGAQKPIKLRLRPSRSTSPNSSDPDSLPTMQ
jgi:hypothetical protein